MKLLASASRNWKLWVDICLRHPSRLFLLDAFGAILSAFGLGLLLPAFEEAVGWSPGLLRWLALVALLLAMFGLASSRWAGSRWPICLLVLCLANASYALFTFFLLVIEWEQAGWLSRLYFPLEIMILMLLISFEWAVWRRSFAG